MQEENVRIVTQIFIIKIINNYGKKIKNIKIVIDKLVLIVKNVHIYSMKFSQFC